MSQKKPKSWKEHLLSSGVPLEYSVIQIFDELGIHDTEEYRYQRKTADGVPQVFSVDVASSKYDVKRQFWIECLVECKYRHDGTNWVFLPREYGDFFGPSFSQLFVKLDQLCPDRQLDEEILEKFEDKYPLCGKGIELMPEDTNPKSIEQAIQQLRYAVISKLMGGLSYQAGMTDDNRRPIFVIVPIIVTTGALWRMKVGSTVEEVRNAKDLSEVAESHDVLVLLQRPDELNERDTRDYFRDQFSQEERTNLQTLLRRSGRWKLGAFIDYHSRYTPSMFIVISYKRLKSALKNLHNFFANDRLIKLREVQENSSPEP